MKPIGKKSILATAIATVVWSSVALGQTPAGQSDASNSEASNIAPVESIIVTGSRIVRKDFSAESPIVTVGQEQLRAHGPATLEAAMNLLPQLAPDAGSTTASQGAQGRATLNLRGLGSSRTLVLLDGRRLQPGDPLGAVDLNSVPSALIQNVEVITGGASAVYGSDAIAGVVNFRVRDDFEGVEIDVDYGVSDRSDGENMTLAATMGGNFADGRGNAVISLTYLDRERVDRGSRPFFQDGGITSVLPGGLIYPVASNLPSQEAVTGIFDGYGLTTPVSRTSSYGVNPDGSLFTLTPANNLRHSDDGPYVITSNGQVAIPLGEAAPLQQPLKRETVFGRMSYSLTDSTEAYAQFNYAHYRNNQTWYGRNQAITRDVYLPISNPFIPDDLRAIASSRPDPDAPLLFYFNTGRFSPDIAEQTYDVTQYMGGLRGDLDAIDGTWDVYASFGRSNQASRLGGNINRNAYLSLIESPDGGVGICKGGLDPLAISKPSQNCLDYLLRDLHETSKLEQSILEGNIQGRLFALPAGDVSFAAGIGYRKNSYGYAPDAQRINADVLAISVSNPTSGSTESKEAYLEVLVPVLADLPFVYQLDLNGAYRFSDYDTVGGVHTWKLSSDWQFTPSLRMRGGYQKAIRAPSVGELYQPVEQSGTTVGRISSGLGDPCDASSTYRQGANAGRVRDLCIATGVPENVIDLHRFAGTSVQSNVAGNLDLKEETSDSYTIGLVYRPDWQQSALSNLSLSVDYYNIEIKDAIGLITGDVITQRCFNGAGDSNPDYDPQNFYCQLIARGPSGGFSVIDTPLLNLAGYRTAGIDAQLDWSMPVGYGGEVGVNLVASYLDKYSIQTLQGASFTEYAGTIGNGQISSNAISHPTWRTVTNLSYNRDSLGVNLRWRWIDEMSNAANVGISGATAAGVDAVNYLDLNANYNLTDNASIRFGVLNLTDKQPPEWTGEAATDSNLYDVVGRRFFAGMSVKF